MLFSLGFEIGALVLGLLYVADLWFESIIHLYEVNQDVEEKEKEEKEDKEREALCKHLYS